MKMYVSAVIFVGLIAFLHHVEAEIVSVCGRCTSSPYGPVSKECCVEKETDPFDFLLTVPERLTEGTSQRACLNVFRLKGPMLVFATVKLLSYDESTVYDSSNAKFHNRRTWTCFTLTVPHNNEDGQTRVVTLSMELKLLETAHSAPVVLNKTRKLAIVPRKPSLFINTDKMVYKPGQKVQFRVLQLHRGYPTNNTVQRITITDPKNRKLWESRNRVPKCGLVSDKFKLISEALQGPYTIEVEVNKKYALHQTKFEVKEYVLPKFEVEVSGPDYVRIDANVFSYTVCAKYTYGKPVNGSIMTRIKVDSAMGAFSWVDSYPTDISGCTARITRVEDLTGANVGYRSHKLVGKLHLDAEVTDIATHSTETGEFSSKMVVQPYKLEILEWDDFPPKYSFKVLYTDLSGTPLANRSILSQVKFFNGTRMIHNYKAATNREGFATFTFYLPQNPKYSVTIRDADIRTTIKASAFPHIIVSPITKKNIESGSNYISLNPAKELPCNGDHLFTGEMGYNQSESAEVPQIGYQVVMKGELVSSGLVEQVGCIEEGQFQRCKIEFKVHVGYWNVETKMLLFFTLRYKVFSDMKLLPVDCLPNQVNLQFSKDTALPMGNINITLESSPNSVCSFSALDKSVNLLPKKHQEFSKSSLKTAWKDARFKDKPLHLEPSCFSYFVLRGDISEDGVLSSSERYKWIPDRVVKKRSAIEPDIVKASPEENFKDAGLVLLTNFFMDSGACDLHSYDYSQLMYDFAYDMDIATEYYYAETADIGGRSDITPNADFQQKVRALKIKVRNYFPETWKWELIELGATGRVQHEVKLPDTITDWIATTYCVSHDTGIGFANVAKITGFKPMFLSISLPYSVIRGEIVTLRTSLFSYYEQDVCLEMVIFLSSSIGFELLNEEARTSRVCICGQKHAFVDYRVKPLEVGQVKFLIKTWSESGQICGMSAQSRSEASDGVERNLLVESEGIEVQEMYSDYMCVDEDQSKSLVRRLVAPLDHYQDSATVLFNAVGSLMGPSLDNLNQLIQKPFGCGEQNMVTMVPNLVALKYLDSIGQLTETLRDQIEGNIFDGYQRELNYQRNDGSFSAFGNFDSVGSTWLTAFVVSTFRQIKEHTNVSVDDRVVNRASEFLSDHTSSDGCVQKIGLIHDKGMMGGATDSSALTAYVALALHYKHLHTHSGIWDYQYALGGGEPRCGGPEEITTYTKAIRFYTYALKGVVFGASSLWDSLKASAIFDGGNSWNSATACHWTGKQSSNEDIEYDVYGVTNEIETTGYVLLGFLKMNEGYAEEFPISQALLITRWLSSKMNANGGFFSTQDTVVGMTAIAAFSEATNADSLNVNVTVTYGTNHTKFEIDRENMLVTQQKLLRQPPEHVTITTQGSGCVLVQSNFKYNVPDKRPDPSFTLSVHVRSTEGGCGNEAFRYLVVCATYNGTRSQPTSNMAVFEITLVSGYEVVHGSLKKMIAKNIENGLKRYEVDRKKVSLYFRAIGSERKCAGFEIEQKEKVENQKPGFVHVYDYYNPERSATKSYDLNCNWEDYENDQAEIDCLEWNDFGSCHKTCEKRHNQLSDRKSICTLVLVRPVVHDICGTIPNICNGYGKCINLRDSHKCVCNEGHTNSQETCINLANLNHEMDAPLRTAPETAICSLPAWIIMKGGSEHYFCFNGYRLVEQGRQSYCVDIDECLQTSACGSVDQVCRNFEGGYYCHCQLGFEYAMDDDENIVNKSHCVVQPDNSQSHQNTKRYVLYPSNHDCQIPADVGLSTTNSSSPCAQCYPTFPTWAELRSILCPKRNVYIAKFKGNSTVLRAIIRNGTAVTEKYFRFYGTIHAECLSCLIPTNRQLIIITSQALTKRTWNLILDGTVTVIPKRAWRKIQRFDCGGD